MIEMFSGKFPTMDIREELIHLINDHTIVELIKKCTTHGVDKRPAVAKILAYFSLVCRRSTSV